MPFLDLDASNLGHFEARVARLSPQSQRLWGTMTVERMLAHLTRSLEMTLGEVPVEDRSNWLTRHVARPIVFSRWLAVPRGRIKAPPVFFPDETGSFDAERPRLLSAMRRFTDAHAADPARIGASPLFGPVPFAQWAVMHGKHQDHHLRQFGA